MWIVSCVDKLHGLWIGCVYGRNRFVTICIWGISNDKRFSKFCTWINTAPPSFFFLSLMTCLIGSNNKYVIHVVAQLWSSGLLFLRLLPSSPLKEAPPPRLVERDG